MNKKKNKPLDESQEKKLAVIKQCEKSYEIQNNEFSRGIYSCSPMARRLIGYCISNAYKDSVMLNVIASEKDAKKIKKMKVECMSSEFTIHEFLTRLGLANSGENYLAVRKAVEECVKAIICVENTIESFEAYTWFSHAHISKKTDKIEMDFNPFIFQALTEWFSKNKGYSVLKLEMLGQLRSFYAMRYYELAISEMGNEGKNGNAKGEWFFQFSVEEIRTMFEIKDKSYADRMDNFARKIVQIPIDELNEKNPDFKIVVSKIKEKRKVVGFKFFCFRRNPEQAKIEKTDSPEVRQIKSEQNDYRAKAQLYQEKYPELWQKHFEFQSRQNELPFGTFGAFKGFSELAVYNTILAVEKEIGEKRVATS